LAFECLCDFLHNFIKRVSSSVVDTSLFPGLPGTRSRRNGSRRSFPSCGNHYVLRTALRLTIMLFFLANNLLPLVFDNKLRESGCNSSLQNVDTQLIKECFFLNKNEKRSESLMARMDTYTILRRHYCGQA
jgi:hypothetical protein